MHIGSLWTLAAFSIVVNAQAYFYVPRSLDQFELDQEPAAAAEETSYLDPRYQRSSNDPLGIRIMKKESSPSSPDLGIRIMKKNLGLRIMKKDNENLGLRIMKKLSNMDSSTNDGIGIRIMKKNNKPSSASSVGKEDVLDRIRVMKKYAWLINSNKRDTDIPNLRIMKRNGGEGTYEESY